MQSYIVDSFTNEAFKGNPAGVCLLERELSEASMLAIAQEFNLSETAFVNKRPDSHDYDIRYFSPKMEIPLCGHATLASAKVLFENEDIRDVKFLTMQGLELKVTYTNEQIIMEFPVYETEPTEASSTLLKALGLPAINNCVYNRETNILLLEISDPQALSKLKPDYNALYQSHDSINGVLVTAPSSGDGYDFHSRYFWPWSGTNEDPVTGGTHTFLAKYWSLRLGKSKMRSFQSSPRSGFMDVELTEDGKLLIKSQAVIVFAGKMVL